MTDPSAMQAKKGRADNSAFSKRVRRHVIGRVQAYYAITIPEIEDFCREELMGLGCDRRGMTVESGGVTFAGRFVDCQRANLHLRTATRILMRIETFSATNVRQLEKKSAAIPWELFLPSDTQPDLKVSSRRSRLYHTEAICQSLLNGIASRFEGLPDSVSSKTPQTVFARVVDDRFSLSLDSSGRPLHKRGLKEGPARAPIRETLAAAILMAAGYDPLRPLVDPLCGSGTFSLEAAMMAKQMAPGLTRRFAFMGWPAFRESQWAFLKRDAESQIVALGQPRIFASDIDAHACETMETTLAGNGLSDAVRVAQRDFFQCEADHYGDGPGLVIINPPYGIRIGSAKQADDLFNRICRHLNQRFRGWTVALIAPRPSLASGLHFPARRLPLLHGGLRLTLILGTIK